MEGFLCPVCNSSFGDQEVLMDHYKQTHEENPPSPKEVIALVENGEASKRPSITSLPSSDVFRGWFSSGCKKCNPTIEKLKEVNKQIKNIQKVVQKHDQTIQKMNSDIAKWQQDIEKGLEKVKNIKEKKNFQHIQNSSSLENALQTVKSLFIETEEEQNKLQDLLKLDAEKKESLKNIKLIIENSRFDPDTLEKRKTSDNEEIITRTKIYVSTDTFKQLQIVSTHYAQLDIIKREANDMKGLMAVFLTETSDGLNRLKMQIKISMNEYEATSGEILSKSTVMLKKYDNGMNRAAQVAEDIAKKERDCENLAEEISKCTELIQDLQNKKDDYENTLSAKTQLTSEIADMTKENKLRDSLISTCQNQLSEATENNKQISESHNHVVANLEASNKDICVDINALSNKKELVHSELNNIVDQLQILKTTFTTSQSQVKTKLEVLESENKILTEKYEELSLENDKIQTMLDRLETGLLTKKKIFRDSEAENLDLAERGVFLSTESDTLNKSIVHLKEQNEVFKKKNSESLSTLMALNGANKALHSELEELRRTFWQKDESASFCYSCKETFTITVRKHHCRKCGKIFCNECSPKRIVDEESDSVRMCHKCFDDAKISLTVK